MEELFTVDELRAMRAELEDASKKSTTPLDALAGFAMCVIRRVLDKAIVDQSRAK